MVATGLTTAGTVALAGLGVSVAPLVAVILGLVVMVICGRYALGVIRELVRKLNDESDRLGVM